MKFLTFPFVIMFISCTVSLYSQRSYPDPYDPGDVEGFVPIFNGENLDGWSFDSTYWTVEDGLMTGTVTPETILDANSFIIWEEGTVKDFELKVTYRVSAEGNSGINYRSDRIPGKPYALRGYQADIDGKYQWTGQNYEEKRRTFLALRGQVTQVKNGELPQVVGVIGDAEVLTEVLNAEDWNTYHLIVRGNVMTHLINGQLMSVVIDDDTENRSFDGLIGVQVHVGPPMKIEYRDFLLKNL